MAKEMAMAGEGKEIEWVEDMVADAEEGEDGEGDESGSDDPDRLWCICQTPHDDRYKVLVDVVSLC